jgi:hypothetical protein
MTAAPGGDDAGTSSSSTPGCSRAGNHELLLVTGHPGSGGSGGAQVG